MSDNPYGRVEVPDYALPDPSTVIFPAVRADGWAEARRGRALEADVVIVGSGPGGASAARVLAEAGRRVIVVEEGPARSRFRPNQAHTARYHMQEGGLVLARGRMGFPIAAGRGVGGGTLINSALSFRTPTEVLRRWSSSLQAPWWGPEAMAPVFAEVEQIAGVGITPMEVAGNNNLLILKGIEALGLSGGLAPRSTPGCRGCGVCNYGCPSNGKASTNLTFLPRAARAGAMVQADTYVTDLLIEGGAVAGLRGFAQDPDTGEAGGEVVVRAPRVVLSAGAVGTPRLLHASGVAERLGPAVGRGLHVHPGSAVYGVAEVPIHLWRGATQGAYYTDPALPGVLPHTFTAPPEACLASLGLVGPRLEEGLELLPRLCGLISMVSDQAEGRVGAFGDGRADVVYDMSDEDLARIKAGLVSAAQVLLAGGATEVTAPIRGVGRYRSAQGLAAALDRVAMKDFTFYSAHPQSTCRMGLDPERSVVDASGRAHRLEGLYIADASIYPTSLGVNPQLTTMAAGTTVARRMLEAG